MKKEWIKPEVASLGMENTNEDVSELKVVKCRYCKKEFQFTSDKNKHETKCSASLNVGIEEGANPIPMPTLS